MFPSNMTDVQWQVMAKYFAGMNKRGLPRVRSARDMINAIFLRTSHRLPVACAAQGLSALQTGLQHLCPLASARRVGCAAGAVAPAGARQGRQVVQAQQGHQLTPSRSRLSQRRQHGSAHGQASGITLRMVFSRRTPEKRGSVRPLWRARRPGWFRRAGCRARRPPGGRWRALVPP